MKVRATELGYYNNKRRHPGAVFVLKPYKKKFTTVDQKTKRKKVEIKEISAKDQFSEIWMERVDDKTPVKTPRSQTKFGKGMGVDYEAEHKSQAEIDEESTGDEEVI